MAKLNYQNPNSTLTLAEGLAEYYHHYPHISQLDHYVGTDRTLLEAHDICHIVFGCDNGHRGELMIDIWSLFGTTLTLNGYLRYLQHPIVKKIFQETNWWLLMKSLASSLPAAMTVLINCFRLKKKWNFFNYQEYLEQPLKEIRGEFGIQVVY